MTVTTTLMPWCRRTRSGGHARTYTAWSPIVHSVEARFAALLRPPTCRTSARPKGMAARQTAVWCMTIC